MDFKVQIKIILLGLDLSGKTTILNKLLFNEVKDTIPTIGFDIQIVDYNNNKFAIWDMSGYEQFIILWMHYYEATYKVIFVIDSSDQSRFPLIIELLQTLTENKELLNVPFLIIASKQDKADALSVDEIKSKLTLDKIFDNRIWGIIPHSMNVNDHQNIRDIILGDKFIEVED